MPLMPPSQYRNGGYPELGDIWGVVPNPTGYSDILYRNVALQEPSGRWLVEYRYNHEDTESWHPLVSTIGAHQFGDYYLFVGRGPKVRKKSGFGKFINRIEEVS